MKFTVIIVQVVLFLTIASHGAQVKIAKTTTLEEDSEMERQLNILNKPPIKTFKDEDGSIIDCIDIHKQPALDHPLLKNHKIQMRPSSLPEGMRENVARFDSGTSESAFISWECPHGTVPFRRTTKEDLIRANAALDDQRIAPTDTTTSPPETESEYFAIISTRLGLDVPSENYYGAKVQISVYNLTNIVSPQTSSVSLWIGTKSDGPVNSLEFGWTVNPQLYGDTKTRTYSYWTANEKGCFNTQCPGYVQVSQTKVLGLPIDPVSALGQRTYYIEFALFRDPKTGNWWLAIANSQTQGKFEQIGYWPNELFTTMKGSANSIYIGGKVFNPANMTGSKPQMGSGVFKQGDKTRTCYASNIEFVNSHYQFYPPKGVKFDSMDDLFHGYTLDWFKDSKTKFGFGVMFGGPDNQ